MGSTLKFTILLMGVLFVVSVINLLVKRRINERNSFLWLAGSLAILTLSAIPDVLDIIAHATGIDYPPTLLFLLSILIILFILLYQSIQISILQEKCKELAQHLAIVNFNDKAGWRNRREIESGEGEGVKEAGHDRYSVKSNESTVW